jgi:Protein of unknown function (DUF2497)
VTAAALGVDVAALQVKINEGALYPTVVATLSAQQAYSPVPQPNVLRSLQLQAFGTVTVPFYQGGAEYATIRQSKETLGRTGSTWTTSATRSSSRRCRPGARSKPPRRRSSPRRRRCWRLKPRSTVSAKKARVGQRTTLDVLNATQELLNARTALVQAQRRGISFAQPDGRYPQLPARERGRRGWYAHRVATATHVPWSAARLSLICVGAAASLRLGCRAVDREFEALSRVVSGSWNARLDAMAREMMRPMLRVWLDRHLPKLVRQLVREEIARRSGTGH